MKEKDIQLLAEAYGAVQEAGGWKPGPGAYNLLARAVRGEEDPIDSKNTDKFANFGDMLREYINEAEHQDGDGYWDNFNSLKEVLEDIQRYFDNYVI
jgi:hypothetical protein